MPVDEYDLVGKGKDRRLAKPGSRVKYVVIYVDADNCKVMRESPLHGVPVHRAALADDLWLPVRLFALHLDRAA
jgi:hypothetical protein